MALELFLGSALVLILAAGVVYAMTPSKRVDAHDRKKRLTRPRGATGKAGSNRRFEG